MTVLGLMHIELHLPDSQSLKQKRSVIKSLKDRLRDRFNVSVAEVDHLDKWQRSTIAIVIVANDRGFLESSHEKIARFIENEILGRAIVTARELTFL